MRPRTRTRTASGPLTDCLAAILLHGPRARPPEGCDAAEHDRAFWHAYSHGFSVLWTRHEAQARQRAKDWGWAPETADDTDAAPLFWGEYFARDQARYGIIA